MKKTTAALSALLLAALTATTGCSLLEKRYPEGDPTVLAGRLTDRAQWAYASMALPEHAPVRPVRIETGYGCHTGIDRVAEDVRTYGLRWQVPDVPIETARPTGRRLRAAFVAAGWKITHDGNRQFEDLAELGFRAEDPATGDLFDLTWNTRTTTLFLDGHTPCAKVPHAVAEESVIGEPWAPHRP
ncbi:hypothetical protein ABZV60_02830 [Streptomyces sp. NPDC004787]|uniref:hypothetical protein n=1 Tax=Streptomyces sp. NPDC004787 TaxID=3154291 RepID=UPI00339ED6F7